MTSKPQPKPINKAPKGRPIIAWCPELSEWAVVEYSSADRKWRETMNYGSVNPTHWLPIELPEVQP